jgi:hypothetical protein
MISTDWLSYPILDITKAPEAVDIVLINRPKLPPAGGAKARSTLSPPPSPNAVFDATGVRLSRAPLTPQPHSGSSRRSPDYNRGNEIEVLPAGKAKAQFVSRLDAIYEQRSDST